MKKTGVVLAVIGLAVAATAISAQETNAPAAQPAEHFYKLNLVVAETSEAGKVVNSRAFVATIQTNANGTQSIRTGDRVPVSMTGGAGGVFQYLDMGVNFDISRVKESGGNLSFRLGAEVSSFAHAQESSTGGPTASQSQSTGEASPSHPVIRQNKWDSTVLIPVGKPSVVFSADDLQGKGKMQVEVTATRID